VAEGLQAANSIGLIHGDVKPANILMDDQGLAKLVDFGIARLGGGQINDSDALGTPHYVAPEQASRQSLDFRADMYSLGATLYHALTGTPPFTGKTIKEILQARLKGPPPDVRAARADLHPATAALVSRMMNIDPADRYASYDDLLADLRKTYQVVTQKAVAHVMAGQQAPIAAPAQIVRTAPAQKAYSPARITSKRKRRDLTALVIILLGLMATLGIVLVLTWWAKHST